MLWKALLCTMKKKVMRRKPGRGCQLFFLSTGLHLICCSWPENWADKKSSQPGQRLPSRIPATPAPHGYFWLTLPHHCNLKPATLQAATTG